MYVPARSLQTTLATVVVAVATPLAIQAAHSSASAAGSDFQYVTRTSVNDSSTSREVVAQCPTGMAALGGGAFITNAAGQALLTGVYPENGPDGSFVRAAATEDADGYDGGWWLTVTAVCGKAPAGLEYVVTKGATRTAPNAGSAAGSGSADCAARGKHLIGTGFWNTDRSSVSAITPTDQGVRATSAATRLAPDAADPASRTVYAVCATSGTGFTVATATSTADSVETKSAVATCPAGTRIRSAGTALAGATDTQSGETPGAIVLDDLAVLPDFNAARVVAYEDQFGTDLPWSVTAYAICG